MWKTEINIFLQSFSTPYLTNFFKFITGIGGEVAALTFSIIIMFGLSFRKGFILIQLCTFSRCVNDVLKILFALPRPVTVDSNVQILWKNKPNTTPLTSMGAKKFFSMLPKETIDTFRAQKLGSFGFPSGTSTRAISFWGMVFMLYKKVWIRIIAVLFVILIPFSRIYFGRHFLADVLGSFIVSFIIIGIFYALIYKNKNLMRYLFDDRGFNDYNKLIILIICLFAVPFVLILVPELAKTVLGPLIGLNAAYMVIRYKGVPKDDGRWIDRMARVVIAGICYTFFLAIPEKIFKNSIVMEIQAITVCIRAIGSFLFIWSAVKISTRLGFFKE